MPHTLTFTGHGSSWCKVNNQTVTFPYTLKNGDVITFGNNGDQDQYFTVNEEKLTSGSSTLSNTNIAIVGVVASPVREDEYTINYTEVARKSVDLTTLTGWANLSDGGHTITIKAKADGYRDSQASAGVSVTKGAGGYTVTMNYSGYNTAGIGFYSLDVGSTWIDCYVAGQTKLVLNNVEQIMFKVVGNYNNYINIYRTSGDSFTGVSVDGSTSATKQTANITLTQDMVVQIDSGID